MIDSDQQPAAPEQSVLIDPLRELETNREAMVQVAADARRIYQQGGKLSNWQQRALREAAFYELQSVCWQDRASVAADVKRWTGMTYNALDKAQCPWNAHGPTPKVLVLEWLVQRLAADAAALKRRSVESRDQAKSEREVEQVQLRRLKAKADIEETQATKARDKLQAEAEDAARKVVLELTTQLRRGLVDEAPPAIASEIIEKKMADVAAVERTIRLAIEAALQAVHG